MIMDNIFHLNLLKLAGWGYKPIIHVEISEGIVSCALMKLAKHDMMVGSYKVIHTSIISLILLLLFYSCMCWNTVDSVGLL